MPKTIIALQDGDRYRPALLSKEDRTAVAMAIPEKDRNLRFVTPDEAIAYGKTLPYEGRDDDRSVNRKYLAASTALSVLVALVLVGVSVDFYRDMGDPVAGAIMAGPIALGALLFAFLAIGLAVDFTRAPRSI